MLKIGAFSKISNTTVRALHLYEEMGILVPEEIDTQSKYRYYSAKQLKTVNEIKMLQQIGLSLKVIKEVIVDKDMKVLEYHYELRQEELQKEMQELQMKQTLIKSLKANRKEGKQMEKYNVVAKEIPSRNVMSIRKKVTSFEEESMLWNMLYQESLQQHVQFTNPPMGMTIYHDKEYKDSDIDIEVQSNIVGNYKDSDVVRFYEAEGFMMASVTFSGSYDQMNDVTQALASWIEANGCSITGPMVNIPIVSPAQDPNPENWITEAGYMITK